MTAATSIYEAFNPTMPDPVELAHMGSCEAFDMAQSLFVRFDDESLTMPRTMLVPKPGQSSTDPVFEQARKYLRAAMDYGHVVVSKVGNVLCREVLARQIEIDRQVEQGVPDDEQANLLSIRLERDAESRSLQVILRDMDGEDGPADYVQLDIPPDAFSLPTELIDLLTPEQSADMMIRLKQIMQVSLNGMLADLHSKLVFGIDGWLINECELDPLHLLGLEEFMLDMTTGCLNVLNKHIATFTQEADAFALSNPSADRAVLEQHPLIQALRAELMLQQAAIEEIKAVAGMVDEEHATAGCCGQCVSCDKH